VHHDDDPPYYTIHVNGREKQTTGDRLFPIGTVLPPMRAEDAVAAPTPAPPASGFGFIAPTQAAPIMGGGMGGGDSYSSAFSAGDGEPPQGDRRAIVCLCKVIFPRPLPSQRTHP